MSPVINSLAHPDCNDKIMCPRIAFYIVPQTATGPREDDPVVADSSTVTTFTPSAGDNPIVMGYTSISLASAEISRRGKDALGYNRRKKKRLLYSLTKCVCLSA